MFPTMNLSFYDLWISKLKILTFTTLYPNSVQPRHGIFIQERLRHLAKMDDISIQVVAPVPWFPFKSKRFGKYSLFSQVPKSEVLSNLKVIHPKFPVLPKIGMSISPILLAGFTYRAIRKIQKQGYDFDVIDCHYFYPDGVAAVLLGKILKKPVMVTARGSDINLIPNYYLPRKLIQWAAKNAQSVATVSENLKEKIALLGISLSKINVFRNGVDLKKFTPLEREKIRKQLNVSGFVMLSVGNLIELKGHHLVIEALSRLEGATLFIAGEGEMQRKLKLLANDLNVSDRVIFTGNVTQSELCELYNAADVLVLASSREGMANVVLESLACGTPVIATDVGGNREVVQNNEMGLILSDRSTESIVTGVQSILKKGRSRERIRAYAESLSWSEVSLQLKQCFNNICYNPVN